MSNCIAHHCFRIRNKLFLLQKHMNRTFTEKHVGFSNRNYTLF